MLAGASGSATVKTGDGKVSRCSARVEFVNNRRLKLSLLDAQFTNFPTSKNIDVVVKTVTPKLLHTGAQC